MPRSHPLISSPPHPITRLSRCRVFAILAVCLVPLCAAQAGVDHSLDAVCRISAMGGQRGVGSGCVFHLAEGRVLVITAAHVVEHAGQVSCEFWHRGHQSRALPAVVIGADRGADVAVLALHAGQFGGVLPEVIPPAAPDEVVRPGETLYSAGCSGGAWATAFQGHARGYEGTNLYFAPAPANGRSGSALCNAQGRIVGVVTARTNDNVAGIATSIQAAYAAWGSQGQRRTALAAVRVQPAGRLVPVANSQCRMTNARLGNARCPMSNDQDGCASGIGHWSLVVGDSDCCTPEGCPGGICDPYGTQPRWYLLPYRYREQFRNQNPQPSPQPTPPAPGVQGPTWPTLPGQDPGTDSQAGLTDTDLSGVNQRLDRIAGLLEQLAAGMAAAQSGKANAESGGAEVQRAVEDVADQVDQVRDEVQQETGRLRQAVEAVVANREEILERIQERLAKVQAEQGPDSSRVDVARGYARDFAAEQLSSGVPGLTLGHILGGALGLSGPLAFALGGGLWLLSRRIGARLEK